MIVLRSQPLFAPLQRCYRKQLITVKYRQHLQSFLPKLRAYPFLLQATAGYLQAWLDGTCAQGCILDVAACVISDAKSSQGPRAVVVLDSEDLGAEAMALEPEVGQISVRSATVVLGSRRRTVAQDSASTEATFRYGIASMARQAQGWSWTDALSFARAAAAGPLPVETFHHDLGPY